MPTCHVTEAQTRYSTIDPQLKKAGWNLSDRTQVAFEIPVAGYDGSALEGFTDYCLYRSNGEVLAVIGAKRSSRDARLGKPQLVQYLEAIAQKQAVGPFGFMANGEDVFFWQSDRAPKRYVARFVSRKNCEQSLGLREQNTPVFDYFILCPRI